MKKGFIFAKRNFIEMLRDPVIYIFCIGFPVALLVLFCVINRFTYGHTIIFEPKSLIPGIIMFSFSFVMLQTCLSVSKDKSSAFLMRLYVSPMRTRDFLIGYILPGIVVGLIQEIVCLLCGFFLSLITKETYFGWKEAVLLAFEMLPMLLFFVFAGILAGTLLNDKSAPGVASVFISAGGILGGAWMPLDTMGAFETFCRFLPFYPSVYIGRIITGASHSVTNYETMETLPYVFDSTALLSVITVSVYCLIFGVCAAVAFSKMMKSDKK